MPKPRFTAEQIIKISWEAEASQVQVSELCRKHGIAEQTFYRWRQASGGCATEQCFAACWLYQAR